jgi:hypothetical protein
MFRIRKLKDRPRPNQRAVGHNEGETGVSASRRLKVGTLEINYVDSPNDGRSNCEPDVCACACARYIYIYIFIYLFIYMLDSW